MPKQQVEMLNRDSMLKHRVKMGTKLDQLMSALALIAGGTGIMAPQHTLSNSTTALSFTAFTYYINGVPARKAAGTQALTATTHDVAQDKWASYRASIQANGTVTITKSADQDTEAEAVAALPAIPANEASMGYFVVRGGTGGIFDATTHNLQTGGATGVVVKFFPATVSVPDTVVQLT